MQGAVPISANFKTVNVKGVPKVFLRLFSSLKILFRLSLICLMSMNCLCREEYFCLGTR